MNTLSRLVGVAILAAANLSLHAAPAGDPPLNFSRLMGRIVGGVIILIVVLKLAGVGKKKDEKK